MKYVIFLEKIFGRKGIPEGRRGPFRETGGNFWKNSEGELFRVFAAPNLRGMEGGYLHGGHPLGEGVGEVTRGCGSVPMGEGCGRGVRGYMRVCDCHTTSQRIGGREKSI